MDLYSTEYVYLLHIGTVMNIEFVDSREFMVNAKATIHRNGKLGFSSDAANKMELAKHPHILIGLNRLDKDDENLYVKTLDEPSEAAFKVIKAGDYYYINTKNFFDSLNLNYRAKRIVFDIIDFDLDGQRMFKFLKREDKKRRVSE